MTTSEDKNKLFGLITEVLSEQGVEGFRPVMEWLLNAAMRAERSDFLKAEPNERTEDRIGYANGYKGKTVQTRMGELRVEIPQVRGLSFYPKSLERGCRSEVALKLAIAEMYVQGVATRRVNEITEALCGLEISSTQVSRISQGLDEKLNAFRQRELGSFPFVILDARYEKVRHGNTVRDCAVLLGIGINDAGRREILDVSVSLSEAEIHWKKFLEGLQKRGLKGVQLIVSDDHTGLKAARQGVFPSIPWQRCQFHLAQNAQAYAPSHAMRPLIGQAMRDIFNAPSLQAAREMVKDVVNRFQKSAPEFTKWLEENVEEGFAVYAFPRPFWRKLRTSNMLENVNGQIKRRTRVARIFPNPESCLRLITAVVQEIHEDWITGRKFLDIEHLNQGLSDHIYRKKVA